MSVAVFPGASPFLQLPASKSQALRALILASLASPLSSSSPFSSISNFTLSGDAKTYLSNSDSLFVLRELDNRTLNVSRGTWCNAATIHCGQSAFLARTLPFILAGLDIEASLMADIQLVRRNHSSLFELLKLVGIEFSITQGSFPIAVRRANFRHEIDVSCQQSSQPVSGLLMALPLLPHPTRVHLGATVSRGYIDMTLDCMRVFGAKFRWIDGQTVDFEGNSPYRPARIHLESDWSAAAYFVAVLPHLPSGSVNLSHLDEASLQPDGAILHIARQIGMRAECLENEGTIAFSMPSDGELAPFTFDATNSPDLIPPLVALACSCRGQSTIIGMERLVNKESNRRDKLVELLLRSRIAHCLEGNSLIIQGGSPVGGFSYDPADDHRMAMTAAVLSLAAASPIRILNAECVEKSYPDFFTDLEGLSKG